MQIRKSIQIPAKKMVANRRRPLRKFNLTGYKAGLKKALIRRIQRPVEFCLQKLSCFRSVCLRMSRGIRRLAVEENKDVILTEAAEEGRLMEQTEIHTGEEETDPETILVDHQEQFSDIHHQDEIKQFCLALMPLMNQIRQCPDAQKRGRVMANIESAIVAIMDRSCNK